MSGKTGEVEYGIRPEHLSFGVEGQGLKATVDVVQPTGADIMVVAHVARQEVQTVQRDRVKCKPGDTLWRVPDASRVHLFDS